MALPCAWRYFNHRSKSLLEKVSSRSMSQRNLRLANYLSPESVCIRRHVASTHREESRVTRQNPGERLIVFSGNSILQWKSHVVAQTSWLLLPGKEFISEVKVAKGC